MELRLTCCRTVGTDKYHTLISLFIHSGLSLCLQLLGGVDPIVAAALPLPLFRVYQAGIRALNNVVSGATWMHGHNFKTDLCVLMDLNLACTVWVFSLDNKPWIVHACCMLQVGGISFVTLARVLGVQKSAAGPTPPQPALVAAVQALPVTKNGKKANK